ncbi:MAG TPA: site-2 protease family protein [Patescibacteria group bacterium]
MLITFLVFIFILGLLVFVHEFGHFWVAKRSGIKVHEFAFGFRPRLFSWKRGDTEYAINLLPLGGYVRLEGEDQDPSQAKKTKDSFAAQPVGVRAAVLVAGIVMNLVLAWALLTATYSVGSLPLSPSFAEHPGLDIQPVIILADVTVGSPAQIAGLRPGDTITAINGESLTSVQSLVSTIQSQAGKEISLTYIRDGRTVEVHATPRENPPVGEGALGIAPQEVSHVRAAWYRAPFIAIREVGAEIKGSFLGFIGFVQRLVVKQEVSEDVSGIIGVGALTGTVRRLGVGPLMQFMALISTNLAVINILPILPLDGGHLLFVGLEALRRKPVPEKYRQWVALAGLAAIGLLFVIVTYQDLLRFSIFDHLKSLI